MKKRRCRPTILKYTEFDLAIYEKLRRSVVFTERKEDRKYRNAVILTAFIALTIFIAIMYNHYRKPIKSQLPTSDNTELNNIEQYHLSEGRSIKFVEDIFP